MATLEGRLFLFQALIDEFEQKAKDFNPYEEGFDKLQEIIRRAHLVGFKIAAEAKKYKECLEIQDQILQMQEVIKKLEFLHTKRV